MESLDYRVDLILDSSSAQDIDEPSVELTIGLSDVVDSSMTASSTSAVSDKCRPPISFATQFTWQVMFSHLRAVLVFTCCRTTAKFHLNYRQTNSACYIVSSPTPAE